MNQTTTTTTTTTRIRKARTYNGQDAENLWESTTAQDYTTRAAAKPTRATVKAAAAAVMSTTEANADALGLFESGKKDNSKKDVVKFYMLAIKDFFEDGQEGIRAAAAILKAYNNGGEGAAERAYKAQQERAYTLA